MALRSSPPPAFVDQDVPSSPPLPAARLGLRKRHFADCESLSSDPIFSEDASESDEYNNGRRKRLYKGPWWRHGDLAARVNRPAKQPKPVDSGVWMGSDLSDDSIAQSRQCMRESTLPSPKGSSPPLGDEPAFETMPSIPSAERLAARIVFEAVEQGHEDIDLS